MTGQDSVARMWRANDLGGLELFTATVTAFAFHPHAHAEFFVALTEHGLVAPTYRGDKHVIGPGELIVLNPEEAHAGGPPTGLSWTYRAIYPDSTLMCQVMAEFPGAGLVLPWFERSHDAVRDQEVARATPLSPARGVTGLDRLTSTSAVAVVHPGATLATPRTAQRPERSYLSLAARDRTVPFNYVIRFDQPAVEGSLAEGPTGASALPSPACGLGRAEHAPAKWTAGSASSTCVWPNEPGAGVNIQPPAGGHG
jgi:hypothetical protein